MRGIAGTDRTRNGPGGVVRNCLFTTYRVLFVFMNELSGLRYEGATQFKRALVKRSVDVAMCNHLRGRLVSNLPGICYAARWRGLYIYVASIVFASSHYATSSFILLQNCALSSRGPNFASYHMPRYFAL
jgi:hypothetical protein